MGEPRVWSPLQGCAPWALKRSAPLGLPPPSKAPRVWSPLQGYAPWALKRVAPLGLTPPPSKAPRVWSPLQGCAPWALKRVAPLGLTLPPGNCQGARLSGHNTSPRTTRDKRAVLGERAALGKRAVCGKRRSVGRPCRASGLWARANLNGCASPYRGDPSPKPRVRSPVRATKPWGHTNSH